MKKQAEVIKLFSLSPWTLLSMMYMFLIFPLVLPSHQFTFFVFFFSKITAQTLRLLPSLKFQTCLFVLSYLAELKNHKNTLLLSTNSQIFVLFCKISVFILIHFLVEN